MPAFKDFIDSSAAVTIADADQLYVYDDDADANKKITWSSLKSALASDLGVVRLIEESTVSGSPATITFSSIPQTFESLEIVLTGQSATNASVNCRFNADSGANYASTLVVVRSSTGTGSAGQAEGQTAMIRCGGLGAAGGSVRILVPGYARTDTNKTLEAFQVDVRTSSPYSFASWGTNVWLSDAAITSITIGTTGMGNLEVGCKASLYGCP